MDAYDARPADYLNLVNDSRGIGVQNTRIAAGGYYVARTSNEAAVERAAVIFVCF